MSWRCRRVRRQLALFVGNDLTECERRAAVAHVAECASCREYLISLERSRESLLSCCSEPGEPKAERPCPSLWPALRSRLDVAPTAPAPRMSWLPAGALTAASVAIAIVLWHRPTAPGSNTPLAGPPIENIQRGNHSVDATNRDAFRPSWMLPETPTRTLQPQTPPVRSLFLLESGTPAATTEEEL